MPSTKIEEVFPLTLRLREALRFAQEGESVIAERSTERTRYLLRPWQHAMLTRFDGRRTFREVAEEVRSWSPGDFTDLGLCNFYNWLCDENLVLCECESVFELVGKVESENSIAESNELVVVPFARRVLRNKRFVAALKISAVVVFSLSVIRIAYVAAPIFEPPVNRIYAEATKFFPAGVSDASEGGSIAKSERTASPSSMEKMELAARAIVQEGAALDSDLKLVEERRTDEDGGLPAKATERERSLARMEVPEELVEERIEELRQRLEECRIRRDEFYLQNDEGGYRREVHRMTNLVREIGDLEESL